MLDQTFVGSWLDGQRLLREAKEQRSAVPRGPSVEAERELVQVVVQMRCSDGTLMGAEQSPFEQGDEAVHPRQTFGRKFLLSSQQCDAMAIAGRLEPVVAVPPIGMHEAAGLDRRLHKGLQAVRGPVGDPTHPNPPDAVAHFFGRDNDQRLRRRRPPCTPPRPPTKLSSTSTRPDNRSRPGLTIARRSLSAIPRRTRNSPAPSQSPLAVSHAFASPHRQ